MRRAFLIVLVLGIIVAIAIREVRLHRQLPLEMAYVGVQGATLWNGTAEVRTSVATLAYGEPVQVFQRDGGEVLVATKAGVRGWVSEGSLLSVGLWGAAALLNKTTGSMAVQARGHTRARSNLHIRPGRQWEVITAAPGDTPVEMFEREAVANPKRQSPAGSASGPSLEDWWLVRANMRNAADVSGWVLGLFVSLDLPEPLPEFVSSEGIGIVSWFEINRAVGSTGIVRPEYLVMGTRDREGRPCDFTLIRVYTWSPVRHRYETAFMEHGLCGSLPVETTPATRPGGEAHFGFHNAGVNGVENRKYEMKLTTIRRIDADGHGGGKEKRR